MSPTTATQNNTQWWKKKTTKKLLAVLICFIFLVVKPVTCTNGCVSCINMTLADCDIPLDCTILYVYKTMQGLF